MRVVMLWAFIHRVPLLNNGDLLSIECEVMDVQMVMVTLMNRVLILWLST